jgi:hypothetical protein
MSRDSIVGIATSYGLGSPRNRSLSSGGVKNFLHIIQTGSGAHPATYPVGSGDSFPGDKEAGA